MITHVAIRFRGTIWSLPKSNRHHDVIRMIGAKTGVTYVDAYNDNQGFLDDKGQYLTREEAFQHARYHGQLKPRTDRHPAGLCHASILFSEDVW